jgi:adenylate cyclase
VSILFCDIRGFSRISERIGPDGTDRWIRDVMDSLSDCVWAHEGVLVNYIGDEVMAMWGAPDDQPDHAKLACRAALDMLARLPALNERWQGVLQEPMALGIGVNTGMARVGNTGSGRKLNYGPLGNTVNMASRVQGATKYLKSDLLITGSTYEQLDDTFPTRRLCKVAVVNIAEPVALYEVGTAVQGTWAALQQGYEKALEEFERKEFRKAIRILGNLLALYSTDGPSLVLLSRAVNYLIEEPGAFDPVWPLPGK